MTTIPGVRTDRLEAICQSRTKTLVKTRNLTLAIDEPEQRGGTNTAMSPTETLMASLLGCVNVVLTNTARRESVELTVENISLEYDFDTRGVLGLEDIAVPFTAARLNVEIRSLAPDEALESVKSAYNRACPVTRTLRAAGCKIDEEWTVIRT